MTILLFGITQDIIGKPTLEIPTPKSKEVVSAGRLRQFLLERYPALKGVGNLAIAVNNVYATDESPVVATDEIALIPPVSGG